MRGNRDRARAGRRVVLALVASCVGVAMWSTGPVGAAASTQEVRTLGDPVAALPDLDARAGQVTPSSEAQAAVTALRAHVDWNRFGTPRSLIRYGGYLATGLSGTPAEKALSFISTHRDLFRLSQAGVDDLELLADSPIVGTSGHAVIYRQTFGGLPATQDGMITVGVNDTGVFYVSSSAAGDGTAPAEATLSATDAWSRAAADVGRSISAGAISNVRQDGSWTTFDVDGFAQPQRARLVAFPTYTQGVKAAYETIVLDATPTAPTAYKEFVDARTGAVLFRQNAVQNLAEGMILAAPQTGFFQGSTGGPDEPCSIADGATFDAPAGTKSIDVAASADNPVNDIVLNLVYVPTGDVVASSDTATSPEVVHYAPAVVPPGQYAAQVCQFDVTQEGFSYSGFYAVNDTVAASYPYPPKWRYFQVSPQLDYSDTDIRILACWEASVGGAPVEGCQSSLKNLAARGPWDYDFRTNQPTFTTTGNAARTAQAWTSPLTPGEGYQPVSLSREYDFPWTNEWFDTKCDQASFASPQRNDIDAAIVNLFSGHNRFHDWSYFLGFTETNSNLQDDNFGNTNPGPFPSGREGDPELGDVQAGAVDGGAPTYEGRDNANQITLNDGIPGITNQYLFQPIAGSFYAPCVDGDFDTTVFGHEYTHAISNRMVAGPDSGLSGYQAGSMGESWSDLDALEYLHEYGLVPLDGENDWAEGPYVTGNKVTGIRDYALNKNPLNYSDLGFDIPGPEVHADGEVWNGTNYDLRQLLVKKYNAQFPVNDQTLQLRCANGELPADQCPGNRRWIQIMYDAWLLQPADTSMLDARDAYLAADVNRFGGADQKELWLGFARRGMGQFAFTDGNTDTDPIPSFESPAESDEARVTFKTTALDVPGHPAVAAQVFVGDYEARVTPTADTDPSTDLGNVVNFVPGTYSFRVRADGYGLHGFRKITFTPGQRAVVTFQLPRNWASAAQGATASGDGTDLANLLDDTESTDWTAADDSGDNSVIGKHVMIHLGGTGTHRLGHLHVSAMLTPGQGRFTALRQFELWTCDAAAKGTPAGCSDPADFTKVYTSTPDAFPSGLPRPLAPDLIIRPFGLPAGTTATDIMLVVLNNQCTGGPAYQGEQDNDPTNDTDCPSASARDQEVHAAEVEVFITAANVTVSGRG